MQISSSKYSEIKKRYFKFLKKQEALSEPFRNKVGQLNDYYLPICDKINQLFNKDKITKVIGLTGGQGSGKSTISQILQIILKTGFNLNTVIFSIDDFYKTYKERKKLSRQINPLLSTRGVPGTHDIKLLFNCLYKLKNKRFKKHLIPKFDKAIDDRAPKNKWQKIKKKPNIVIFEGWCVGVPPQKNKDLTRPINKLEKEKDKKKIWRSWVNKQIKTKYNEIFKLIDSYIFLKVPSFNYVYKWRLLQEKKLRKTSTGKKVMNKTQIKKFIMYYERLTKHMLKNFDKNANFVIKIDKSHKLKSIKIN